MRKSKKIIAGMMTALALFVITIPNVDVKADTASAKTYTVTFRAGNVGEFNQNVADSDSIDVEKNYIKIQVEKNHSLNDFFADSDALNAYFLNVTDVKTGYQLKNVSELAENITTQEIKRNTEYVLDYVKLVDPVEYVIEFVDAESGEQIATPTIAAGNEGDIIDCNPLAISGYTTADDATTITLVKNQENKVQFHYTYTGETGTVTNIVTTFVPGDTITETVVNPVQAETPVAVVPGAADGGVQIEDEETPLAPGNEEEGEGGVIIEDEETPLGAGEESGAVEIEDEETPLSPGSETIGNTIITSILVGVCALLAVLIVVFVMLQKKRQVK